MQLSLSIFDPKSMLISILNAHKKKKYMAMISFQNLVKERKYHFIFAFAIFLISATIFFLYSYTQTIFNLMGEGEEARI